MPTLFRSLGALAYRLAILLARLLGTDRPSDEGRNSGDCC